MPPALTCDAMPSVPLRRRLLAALPPALRGAALMPAAALLVHQARYELAFGADAPRALARAGARVSVLADAVDRAAGRARARRLARGARAALGARRAPVARMRRAPRLAGVRVWLLASAGLRRDLRRAGAAGGLLRRRARRRCRGGARRRRLVGAAGGARRRRAARRSRCAPARPWRRRSPSWRRCGCACAPARARASRTLRPAAPRAAPRRAPLARAAAGRAPPRARRRNRTVRVAPGTTACRAAGAATPIDAPKESHVPHPQARVLSATLLALALAAVPAAAHEGDPHYRSVVDEIVPATDGLSGQVLDHDDALQSSTRATRT